MYTLTRSRYMENRSIGRWVYQDLSFALMNTLETQYGVVELFVTYPGAGREFLLKIEKVSGLRINLPATMTVRQWLTQLGNTTLPFEDEIPTGEKKYVKYAQAWHLGFDVKTRARNGHVTDTISAHAQEDLMLTHPKFTPEFLDHYNLYTVNGFIHMTDCGTDGLRIIDGNKTIRHSNDNQIGIISFEDIGAIQKVPFTEDMIGRQSEEAPLHEACYFSVPDNIDIENKTVLLVIGGYLQVMGKTYMRVGDRTWRIKLGDILFLERYFDSIKHMDMSELGLMGDPENEDRFSVNALRSDEVILNYLTMSQSFLVIVDTPYMFHELIPLENSGLYNRYLNRNGNPFPVVGVHGKHLDYHIIEEHGFFVYCCSENLRYSYLARTNNWTNFLSTNDGVYPETPLEHEDAFLRMMGVEL